MSEPGFPGAPVHDPQLIILGGASGSGKSYLARKFGRPHVELDSFYREIDDDSPELPLPRTEYDEVDWDDDGTYDADHAADAIERLMQHGSVSMPEYSIPVSRRTGTRQVRVTRGPVVAEGIFAGVVMQRLQQRDVALHAWYITEPRAVTALRRFARDVAERRKPIPHLVRRGASLYRAESSLRRQAQEDGFELIRKSRAKRLLRAI
ncbi:uridine kinase [Agrococcus casei]|uniref:uridine kinase n=1 Tax=Agrococcus casei TaxID=343512 RepID=UPI003F913AAE